MNKVSLSAGLFCLLGFHEAKELSVGADSDNIGRVNKFKVKSDTYVTLELS